MSAPIVSNYIHRFQLNTISGARQFSTAEALITTFLLAVVVFVSASSLYFLGDNSFIPGIVLAGLIVFSAGWLRRPTFIFAAPLALMVTAISVHFIVAFAMVAEQPVRAFASLALLSFMAVSCFCFASWLALCAPKTIDFATSLVRMALVAVPALVYLDIQPEGGSYWEKSSFPFTETSFFALAATPFLLEVCVKSNSWQKYIWLFLSYLVSYQLQALSLAVGTTVVAVVTLPLWQLVVGAFVVSTTVASLELSYFTERLTFADNAVTNLSTLVYIQGWEMATDAIGRSWGWGIGFQQLGFVPFNSPASLAIFRMTMLDKNLTDGGYLAAKVSAEFGVFGILLIAAFVSIAVKSALILRNSSFNPRHRVANRDLALAIIVAFVVDMFVRSVGYFTPSSMLFLAAIIYYLKFIPKNERTFAYALRGLYLSKVANRDQRSRMPRYPDAT